MRQRAEMVNVTLCGNEATVSRASRSKTKSDIVTSTWRAGVQHDVLAYNVVYRCPRWRNGIQLGAHTGVQHHVPASNMPYQRTHVAYRGTTWRSGAQHDVPGNNVIYQRTTWCTGVQHGVPAYWGTTWHTHVQRGVPETTQRAVA